MHPSRPHRSQAHRSQALPNPHRRSLLTNQPRTRRQVRLNPVRNQQRLRAKALLDWGLMVSRAPNRPNKLRHRSLMIRTPTAASLKA